MEINGLPAHVLIVHAAVMFVPLAAASSIVYAGVPRWRWATRLPTVALSAVALGSVVAAWFSGRNFRDSFEDSEIGRAPAGVSLHAERADVLLWLTIVFFAVVLVAAWALGGPSGLISGRGAKGRHNPLIEWSVGIMVLLMAISVMAMTVATGDAGSRAVWEDLWKSIS